MKKQIWKISGIVIGLIIMGIVLWKTGISKIEWIPNKYIETPEYLANMECGFYNMRGVMISDDVSIDEWVLESIKKNDDKYTLELLQIHLGNYRTCPISENGISQICRVFDAYRQKKVRLIVRFLYDWDGRGMESDPESLDLILMHMEQMGDVLEKYQDLVYIVQGVFVGSWAEMHSSRYLSADSYLTLIEKMHQVVPDSVFLAVRTPSYWRMAVKQKNPPDKEDIENRSSLISRLSLFNDGILGNSLDCGTYGDLKKEEAELLSDRWIREDELEFQNQLNLYVPNGGEVVLENPLNDFEEADKAFRTMHLSYLNADHDKTVLEKWKKTIFQDSTSVYNGISGYDYIERHLGYRFVIREASVMQKSWRKKNIQINVQIENVGYANRYTPCEVKIVLKNCENGEIEEVLSDTDVREWNAGETSTFSVPIHLDKDGKYEVYLKVIGVIDSTYVKFANEKIETDSGSYFLGSLGKGN